MGLLAHRDRLPGSAILGIRPDDITFGPRSEANAAGSHLSCQVVVVEPMGSMNLLVVVGR